MEFRAHCRVWALAVYLLATALARTVAADPVAPPIEFHIEGGDATTTLTEFSRQARLQLLFDYNVVKGHKTKPLDGTLSPAEALRRLLADTDLDFDFVNERTLAVMQRKVATGDGAKSAGQPKPAKRPSRQSKSNKLETDTPGGPEEVVRITGTYIRDEVPVGQEIISAGRDDIDATGAATPADFLSTLPQTFGGGPNQDTYIGQEAQSNSGLGVGENLRGLGARATLVLINGRRVAPSGTEGEFVDVENIPMGAIERIDILPDSASATYGADAVGGVVNFILRKNFDGAETIMRGGSGTRGDLQEYLFSQTLGKTWDGGSGLVSFEYYDRGALPAADRSYAVSDLAPFGGGNFNTTLSNPGNIVSPLTGQTWPIPAGQNGSHLTAADLVAGPPNQENIYADGNQIIPSQRRWNLYIDWRQAIGDRVTVFTDVLMGHRDAADQYSGIGATLVVPPSNPFYVNPTGVPGPVMVDYNFGKDLGPVRVDVGIDTLNATLGLDFALSPSWNLSVYGSFVREKQNAVTANLANLGAAELALADPNPATALNPFGDGSFTSANTLAGIRSESRFWLDSQLQTADITADGPIAELPGGPLKLAVGVDRRNQFFTTTTTASSSAPAMTGDLSRSVLSTFGEFIAPVVGDKNEVPGVSHLEFSAAARYENYSTFGNATTPKLGVLWSPVKSLSLRGTWSRATRPPTLSDLDTRNNQAESIPLPNPTAPGGATPTLVWLGGNATVQPERATSWTGGLDFAPPWFSGLTLGLTYFNTVFTDRIQSTTITTNVLTDPAYAAVVTHDPSAAQVAFICTHSSYIQGSASDCINSAPGAIVDLRVRNLATLQTDGIDFNSRYEHAVPLGRIKLDLNGTWLLGFRQAQTPDAPLTSLLNTQNEPINLRMRASAGWELAGFGALTAVNFANSYRDIASTPPRRIDSWTTVDVQLRYDVPDHFSRWLQGTRIELNARNVFNVNPPFLNNQVVSIGYDQENANPYGRVLSLELRKSW
jgi:outer membrane receptor protein involved in Fe transport